MAGCTGGADAHAAAPDGAIILGTERPFLSTPTYRGSVNNSADCSHDYVTSGFEPDDASGSTHPLFLYFTGTNFVLTEAAFRDQSAPAAEAVTRAMARRGFVALKVEYDNTAATWASDHTGLLGCMFGPNPGGVLAVLCQLPRVDCDRGIATWGHSLGAYVAHSAAGFDSRVRAVWTAGYGGDAQVTFSRNRFRVANGENDTTNGQIPTVNRVAGFTAAECPDDGRSDCLRADGSGWIIVRKAECQTSSADHCWFDRVSCLDSATTLEPNWVDPASTRPFALERNADWVTATTRRP